MPRGLSAKASPRKEKFSHISDDYSDVKRSFIYAFSKGRLSASDRKITGKYAEKIYSVVLYKLTHEWLDEKEARNIWNSILRHRKHLSLRLNRKVSLEVAGLDFLFDRIGLFREPLIIDETIMKGIKKNVIRDGLTGLYNFRYYKTRIREIVSQARRYKSIFSIVLFDIDNFKQYNDTYGHLEGNKVLVQIARIGQENLRGSDVFIRYGGEEFLVILPFTSKKNALVAAEKIRQKIALMSSRRKVTVSGGIASFPADSQTDENELFHYADMALYRAKSEGKNRVCLYPKERREFPRISLLEERVKIIIVKKSPCRIVKIRDISLGGLCFFVNRRLNLNDCIKAEIVFHSGQKATFEGQIVWVSPVADELYEIGLRFTSIRKKDMETIRPFLI